MIGIGITIFSGMRGVVVPPLGNSQALAAVGAGLTLSALGGDGMYTATSTGGADGNLYVHSPSAVTGNLLLEVEIVNHANTAAFGLDVAAGAIRGSTNFDESINPDEGYGPNALDYYQNGISRIENLTRNGRFYLERVGSTMNLKTGASWAAAKNTTPLHSRAATSSSPYYLQANLHPIGQWKLRLVQHPG